VPKDNWQNRTIHDLRATIIQLKRYKVVTWRDIEQNKGGNIMNTPQHFSTRTISSQREVLP